MEISSNPDNLTDAQWLGQLAAAALKNGRYALGVELGRLAQRAAHHERTAHPSPLHIAAAAAADLFGNGTREVPLIGSTRVEHPARRDGSHAPSQCVATVIRDNLFETECGEPIQWVTVGPDHSTGTWHHTEPATDDQHAPMPGRGY